MGKYSLIKSNDLPENFCPRSEFDALQEFHSGLRDLNYGRGITPREVFEAFTNARKKSPGESLFSQKLTELIDDKGVSVETILDYLHTEFTTPFEGCIVYAQGEGASMFDATGIKLLYNLIHTLDVEPFAFKKLNIYFEHNGTAKAYLGQDIDVGNKGIIANMIISWLHVIRDVYPGDVRITGFTLEPKDDGTTTPSGRGTYVRAGGGG